MTEVKPVSIKTLSKPICTTKKIVTGGKKVRVKIINKTGYTTYGAKTVVRLECSHSKSIGRKLEKCLKYADRVMHSKSKDINDCNKAGNKIIDDNSEANVALFYCHEKYKNSPHRTRVIKALANSLQRNGFQKGQKLLIKQMRIKDLNCRPTDKLCLESQRALRIADIDINEVITPSEASNAVKNTEEQEKQGNFAKGTTKFLKAALIKRGYPIYIQVK